MMCSAQSFLASCCSLLVVFFTGARGTVIFKQQLNEVTAAEPGTGLILECEATGKPTPTIHWLRNGERIVQGHSANVLNDEAYYEQTHHHDVAMLRLGTTKSRLDLGCLTADDSAFYTCVADTPLERISSQTFLDVEDILNTVDCTASLSAPMIYMWETHRLEFEGADVQLFCRASGLPRPQTTWYDRNNDVITHQNSDFRLLRNGDLLIRNVNWFDHMGQYRCVASNGNDEDEVTSFLYPTLP